MDQRTHSPQSGEPSEAGGRGKNLLCAAANPVTDRSGWGEGSGWDIAGWVATVLPAACDLPQSNEEALHRNSSGRDGCMIALLMVSPGGIALPNLDARLHSSDSTPWTILFALTLITVLPAILMCMTPLVRLLVVFHFLRQALGTQTAPSNPTLLGLGLMMTWFLMAPVFAQVDQQAVEPYRSGSITGWDAIDRGSAPVKHFMLRYAREKDLALFASAGQVQRPNSPDDLPIRVVIPAYILSELKAGFSIGAVLFLPFLLIDMVTAAITTSIGMFQLPPVVVSTPLKILLFVMVDGWNLLAHSLLKSF